MKHVKTILKRELLSYFTQPTAYAIILIFIIISLLFNFTFGRFMMAGDASLEWSFLYWHPWLYMLLAPAVGMKLWSDEKKNGTIELLGTFPIPQWSTIIGKYLAAATVWLVALVLTFPLVITVNYLGDPDNGRILSGFIGSYLTCCVFLAITMLVSACSRDQVVCLIVSVAVCVMMVLCGYEDIIREVTKLRLDTLTEAMVTLGVWDHFRSLTRGLFRYQDMIWFASIIVTCLVGTSAILSAKRA